MKTPFKVLLLALAVLVQPFAERAGAATLRLQDTVVGTRVQNGAIFQTKHTMHYYFFTALVGAPWSSNLCLSVVGPNNNTSLDFHIAQPPDAQGHIFTGDFIGLLNSGFCDQQSGFLPAGQYLLVSSPGNSDWGNGSPLAPFDYADSDFTSFSYDLAFTGEVRLDAVWKGNLDGSWSIITIPEPSAGLCILLAATAALARLRRRTCWAVFSMAPCAVHPPAFEKVCT